MTLSHFDFDAWEAFGLTGQIIFGARFIYQWAVSEKAKKSVVPLGFWWLSIVGAAISFVYAFHKGSIAFMIPVFTGMPVYVRNLALLQREKKALDGNLAE